MRKEERRKGNKRKVRIIKSNVEGERKKGGKEIKSRYRNEMEKLLRQKFSLKGRIIKTNVECERKKGNKI